LDSRYGGSTGVLRTQDAGGNSMGQDGKGNSQHAWNAMFMTGQLRRLYKTDLPINGGDFPPALPQLPLPSQDGQCQAFKSCCCHNEVARYRIARFITRRQGPKHAEDSF